MSAQIDVLRVLVATPSDVVDARECLQALVDEQNRIWLANMNRMLEPILWEVDVVPGVGEDAQDHINTEVGETYDIFLGMMWNRIGTRTPREVSGTVEELERALARFRREPTSIRILMYFCEADIPRGSFDPEQFKQVEKFKERLRNEEGVLYGTYGGLAELQERLRLHLSKLVSTWGTDWGAVAEDGPGVQSDGAAVDLDEDEPGLLDVVDAGYAHFDSMRTSAEEMTRAVLTLGEQLESRTSEMQQLPDPAAGRPYLAAAKMVTQRASTNLHSFCARIKDALPRFREGLSGGIDALLRAQLIAAQFEGADPGTEKALAISAELRDSLEGTITGVEELSEVVGGWPPVSTSLNRAKRATLSVMRDLSTELRRGVSLLSDLEQAIS